MAANNNTWVIASKLYQFPSQWLRDRSFITQKPDGPGANIFVRAMQCQLGQFIVKATADVNRPQCLKCQSLIRAGKQRFEFRDNRYVAPFCKQAPRLACMPIVGMRQQVDELGAGLRTQIDCASRNRPDGLWSNSPDTSVRATRLIPLAAIFWRGMRDVVVIPIGASAPSGPTMESTGRNQMSAVVMKSPTACVANVEPRVSSVLQRQAL